jgi:YHS domain-containing protein
MWLTRPDPASGPPRRARAALLLTALGLVLPGLALPGLAGPARADPAGRDEPAGTRIELLTLNGFDPVSYFLAGGPLAGTARFEMAWGGRVWRFASAANREAFRDAPATYAPRLGGFDAAGILDGRLVDASPLFFAVIGERLYLFRDAARRDRFLADPDLARQAEAAWPALRNLQDVPPRDASR